MNHLTLDLAQQPLKIFIWTATLFLLTSCASVEFVRKDTTPTKQGVLRHSPPSSAKKAEKYRREVDKKAREYCGGAYKITKEYQTRDESNTSTGVGTGFGFGTGAVVLGSSTPNRSMYNFIEFTCGD